MYNVFGFGCCLHGKVESKRQSAFILRALLYLGQEKKNKFC